MGVFFPARFVLAVNGKTDVISVLDRGDFILVIIGRFEIMFKTYNVVVLAAPDKLIIQVGNGVVYGNRGRFRYLSPLLFCAASEGPCITEE